MNTLLSFQAGRLSPLALACLALAVPSTHAADDAPVTRIEIIGTTPLPGLGTPLRDVPANVQSFGAHDFGRQRQGNLSEFLENNPTSISVNAAQGNPYQADISFRGFTASPLVGVPQGLSVFQDGVRINETFGDVVNWDLLPQSAIATLQLIPGSNPVFGLNTLGGALAISTKNGRSDPGGGIELSGGSFGRGTVQLEHGGGGGAWDWFATANVSRDHGWAQHNPSRVQQFFGKLGWQPGDDRVELSLTAANNRLEGTQTLPPSFFDDRTQAYTYPDTNRNRLAMLSLTASHHFTPEWMLTANVYARRFRNENLSSNGNDHYGEIDPETEQVDTVQAFNDRAQLALTSYGVSAQLTIGTPLAGHRNQFVLGAATDAGRAHYRQDSQGAAFDASRGTVATGEFEPETDARTRTRNTALYASDSFALDERWTLTASGRFNDARITIRDQSGLNPDLDGEHRFQRFNPALGINFNPTPSTTAYASVNEGMRAPTAAELTCADPAAPCKLPNSFLADPPLKKVVARTVEVGARGKLGQSNWSASLFRTDLHDDIQFISGGGAALNAGYFHNVGQTRRQGLELSASTTLAGLDLSARYNRTDASFRTGYVENSPANSSADEQGDITIRPGDRIPGIPRQSLRLRVDGRWGDGFSAGANLVANSSSPLRGDENQGDVHGRVAGYAVLNLDARWRLARGVELFARVDNVFNREYANFGVLGLNVFANPSRSFDPANAAAEPFYGLGAPRGVWAGLRVEWD